MKQFILASALAWIAVANSHGGIGTINFLNSVNTRVTLQYPWGQDLGLMPGVPGQFTFQLFIAPAGTTDPLQFVPTNVRGTNVAVVGRFVGGINLAASGVQAGESRSILVRGWSTSLGDDYETARVNWNFDWAAGFLGESQIAPGFIFGGWDENGGPIPPSPAFGGAFGIQSGFALVGVPEPSGLTLIGSGLAIMLVSIRRRRGLDL